ncbi:MAG: glycine oxidase ThiO [Solirubrobacteraceae bacterium]
MSTSETQSPDLVVVGAGVIGLAAAREGARRGLRVTVLDRGEPGSGTTAVAAGMLAPVSEAAAGEDALLALNLASAARYPAWVAALEAESGCDAGYRACGTLLVARDSDQAEALLRELALRADLGLPVERLAPSEARRREPALAPSVRLALSVPEDHAVEPLALIGALRAAVTRAGGEVRAGAEVTEALVAGGCVTGVRLAGGDTVRAGAVLVAAGPWSSELGGLPADARLPVRPVKGQLLHLRDPAGPGLLERVLRTEEAYLVPRGDGRYVLGASVEERGWDTSITARPIFELLREAIAVVPGIAELEVQRALAGLRPGTPDNAPAIGPGALPGLFWATGHHRHGVLLAPVTAELALDAVQGAGPGELGAPFLPARLTTGVAA